MGRRKKIYKKKGKIIKNLTRNILRILKENPKKQLNYKQISAKLGISDSDGKTQILKKLQELLVKKKIKEIERGKYQINEEKNYEIGFLDITSSGKGYFINDQFETDIFIPSNCLKNGLQDDLVKVYIYKNRGSKKLEAEVVEIVERSKKTFIGVLQMSKNFGFVICDKKKIRVDIFVQKNKLNGASHGDKVQVALIDWPENSKNPFGKITKVIGKPGDHETEIHSILLEFDLPYRFEKEVEDDLKNIPLTIDKKEILMRRDMRKDLTFTIDPKDAKDFDDALSFKILENGNFEIGIHIADVSHYVQPDTIIDKEAYHRATSVYLVDRVVPMLPEILSNGVCSLRPNEEKLTFSAVFEMNSKAEIISQWFGRTVIYSNNRFSYEEAQSIIENYSEKTPDTYEIPKNISLSGNSYFVEAPIIQAMIELNSLAKILRKKRMDNGAISFDKVEVKFHLDNYATPTGVYFKEAKQANKLIEEFMLLANKKVAEFIGQKDNKPTNKTFIYRVHDEPDVEKLSLLQNIIKNFGYKINTDTKESISKSLNKLLKDVHGKSEANMVETLTIRSMSKAIYTTENIGHYGLAFDYYSHFTSPIRRYPDVMTHRLLQQYLDGEKPSKKEGYETKCKHASKQEELASKAERQSIKYMQIKYMEKHKNVEFKGVISGVTEWGIYVEINDNKCEGMVRIKDIKSDHYVFDEKQYAMIGQSTKQIYQLGDPVMVKVKNTDLERKHLDFYLIEE